MSKAAPCPAAEIVSTRIGLLHPKRGFQWTVRQHYIRSTMLCGATFCPKCVQASREQGGSSSEGVQEKLFDPLSMDFLSLDWTRPQRLLLPSACLVKKGIDVLKHPAFSGLVFLKSAMHKGSLPLTLNNTNLKIRNITSDSVRCSFEFENRHFIETYSSKAFITSDEEGDISVEETAAQWLSTHLSIPIVILTFKNPPSLYGEYVPEKYDGTGVYTANLREYISKIIGNSELEASLESILIQDEQQASIVGGSTFSYPLHKRANEVQAGLQSGLYTSGILQVNRRNTQEAFVKVTNVVLGKSYQRRVRIVGSLNRNRAIHGDLVAIELLDEEYTDNDEGEDEKYIDIGFDQDDVENLEIKTKDTYGRVIGIIERLRRPIVASVSENEQKVESAKSQHILVTPRDYRYPKIRIYTSMSSHFVNRRIVVEIDRWDATSRYPQGRYVQTIGNVDDLDAEASTILLDHGLTRSPFSATIINSLPVKKVGEPWVIPPDEISRRMDVRETHRIFSIDPPGCEDVDDALSARSLSETEFEIGVHIADVSYFVQHNSPLDLEARQRGTTIYMVDRRIDMLPDVLSTYLCSLREKVDRLAFSVFWRIRKADFEVLEVKFARTVIKSACEMSYQTAQSILDGAVNEHDKKRLQNIQEFHEDLKLLLAYGRHLRKNRLYDGSLELESAEVGFSFGEDGTPTKVVTKKSFEVNKIVSEYMILANKYVGEKIYRTFPHASLLRRHATPNAKDFAHLAMCCRSKGFTFNYETNKKLSESLEKASDEKDPMINFLIRNLTSMAMTEAEYISTGSFDVKEYYHYGLASEFYTHFTSPIRRYADIIAHRQLALAIESRGSIPLFSNEKLVDVATHLNEMHRESKRAQADSVELFRSLYFSRNEVVEEGVVYNISSDGVFVYIPKYGLKKKCFFKDQNGVISLPNPAQKGVACGPENFIKPDLITLIDENDVPSIEINYKSTKHTLRVFDHMLFKIGSKVSKLHSPETVVSIVGFLSTVSVGNTKQERVVDIGKDNGAKSKCPPGLLPKDMIAKVMEDDAQSKARTTGVGKGNGQPPVPRKKTELYDVFQSFSTEEHTPQIVMPKEDTSKIDALTKGVQKLSLYPTKKFIGRRKFGVM